MSQSKVWTPNLGTTVRKKTDGTSPQGAGGSTRLYTGRYGGRDYASYLRFTLDWTGVGKIVSAILTLTTDDGLGTFPSTITENPKVYVRRVVDSWDEGSNDTDFVSGDYTVGGTTSSDEVQKYMNRAEGAVNNIDITAIVEDWAPSTVKRRNGTGGGRASNYGIKLYGDTSTDRNWAGWSEDAAAPDRPYITLTYEYGATVPTTPTNLVPAGAVASLGSFQGDFADVRATDELRYAEVEVYNSASTNAGQTVTGTRLWASGKAAASAAEIAADRFDLVPDSFHPKRSTTYKWRCRVTDQEGQVSLWTDLVSFSVSNTDPNAPSGLTPLSGASRATFDGVLFRGTFSDADVGDYLLAYQVQMSAYPEGDAHWLDDEFILWNTGTRYVQTDSTPTQFETPYGGPALAAGTYYWRARVWDNKHGVSSWSYATIILSADFLPDPDNAQTTVQLRPRAPWRIVIKDMGALRGPGNVVAILEDAKNVGASMLYNSPGELHFTLSGEHPQISVIEPKQTHYSVQFRQGDGWREVFAGLMWDIDATDTDVVFYGIDYLALYDYIADERYDASNPDKPNTAGGSKYVNQTIAYIVDDQLDRAKALANSPVGFITVGAIANMTTPLTVYTTYAQTLTFITSLLDSWRAGGGKKTRILVRQKTAGGYEVVVLDDPGQVRDNLKLAYGELIVGYRVIPFGTEWASRINAIGRAKDGLKVMYKTQTAPGIDESVWGHFARNVFIDGVSDENDLNRRARQTATRAGKLGKQIALGIRAGFLQPRDGYDICDMVPIDIEHHAISTSAFGSGYWVIGGITWETEGKTGKQTTTLTWMPREDTSEPSSDLLQLSEISPQAEWQIGWVPPDPTISTAKKWLDQSTGITYIRQDDGTFVQEANDPRNNNLLVNSGFEVNPIATLLSKVWTLAADWGTQDTATDENISTGTNTLGMTTSTY